MAVAEFMAREAVSHRQARSLTALAASQKFMAQTFVPALLQILPAMSIFDIPIRLSDGGR